MRACPRLVPAALLLALPWVVASGPAVAQQMIRPQQQAVPQAGPAPALPGLAARRAPAPIAGDPAANLSPNAALFDAIGRGDLGAARDAVGRGANLAARNQLGLTPLDAAVDQGRHDIAFYLLSAREVSRGVPVESSPPGATGLAEPPVRAIERAPAASAQRSLAAAGAASPRGTDRGAEAAAPATPRTARLWAGDGGAARPEIGFLGFDAGRPAGATPPTAAPARGAGRG